MGKTSPGAHKRSSSTYTSSFAQDVDPPASSGQRLTPSGAESLAPLLGVLLMRLQGCPLSLSLGMNLRVVGMVV